MHAIQVIYRWRVMYEGQCLAVIVWICSCSIASLNGNIPCGEITFQQSVERLPFPVLLVVPGAIYQQRRNARQH